MSSDVPPLHLQEAEGQFREAVSKIVDGVIEDIRSGAVTATTAAVSQVRAAAAESVYAADVASAAEAIRYTADPTVGQKAVALGRDAMQFEVVRELGERPEFVALYTRRPDGGKEQNARP